jgi:hypothetical protein
MHKEVGDALRAWRIAERRLEDLTEAEAPRAQIDIARGNLTRAKQRYRDVEAMVRSELVAQP